MVAQAFYSLAFITDDPRLRWALLDSAISIQRLNEGTDSIEIAARLDAEGSAFLARGQAQEALASFASSLRILERLVPPEHAYRLTEMNNSATALSSLGRWVEAESLVRAVMTVDRRQDSTSTAVGWDQHRLALLAVNQGHYAEAESLLRDALARLRVRLAPSHTLLRSLARDLAVTIALGGRDADGYQLLDSLYQENLREQPAGVGTAYVNIQRGKMLLRMGRLAEAEGAIRRGSVVVIAKTPETHPYRGEVQFANGLLAMERGELTTATGLFAGILERRKRSERDVWGAGVNCALATALSRQHRDTEAQELRQECPKYAAWGQAEPLVLRWYRESRRAASPSRKLP
jgi:tetratricopeptide (TPR) repeat protein